MATPGSDLEVKLVKLIKKNCNLKHGSKLPNDPYFLKGSS